jgi:hypothetical protein
MKRLLCRIFGHRFPLTKSGAVPFYSRCHRCGEVHLP